MNWSSPILYFGVLVLIGSLIGTLSETRSLIEETKDYLCFENQAKGYASKDCISWLAARKEASK